MTNGLSFILMLAISWSNMATDTPSITAIFKVIKSEKKGGSTSCICLFHIKKQKSSQSSADFRLHIIGQKFSTCISLAVGASKVE